MFKFVKVKEVASPERGTSQSAGIDFFIPNDAFGSYGLGPGESLKIPSGIKMIIPEGYCLQFVNKSGWGSKGLFVGACLVDSDYRGEIHLDIHNFSKNAINLTAGMKIVQAILRYQYLMLILWKLIQKSSQYMKIQNVVLVDLVQLVLFGLVLGIRLLNSFISSGAGLIG